MNSVMSKAKGRKILPIDRNPPSEPGWNMFAYSSAALSLKSREAGSLP